MLKWLLDEFFVMGLVGCLIGNIRRCMSFEFWLKVLVLVLRLNVGWLVNLRILVIWISSVVRF